MEYTCELVNERKQCVRKSLFGKMNGWDGLAASFVFLAAAIVAGAGMGGGGLFVQIFMQIASLTPDESIPLAQATILGGSCANLIWNLRTRHPLDPSRCVIDFQTLLVLQPCIIVGFIFYFPQSHLRNLIWRVCTSYVAYMAHHYPYCCYADV